MMCLAMVFTFSDCGTAIKPSALTVCLTGGANKLSVGNLSLMQLSGLAVTFTICKCANLVQQITVGQGFGFKLQHSITVLLGIGSTLVKIHSLA
jgi:hypothetical protein